MVTDWAKSSLRKLLDSNNSRVIKNVSCLIISNICCGTQKQIEAVISANLIEELINLLRKETHSFDTKYSL